MKRARPGETTVDLMLDSGAFSAWKRGEELDVQEYIRFIRDYQELLSSYVSLDTIPGGNGQMTRSQAEIEKSAAASYKNHQIMKDAGLSPIPVFHQGERFEWLEKMLAEGETYIGISPYLRSSQGEIIEWLDQCFSIVTDSDGYPLVKTHGFGVTGVAVVSRYPWFTVDSTTWAIAGGYGVVRVPDVDLNGNFDFMKPGALLYTGYMFNKSLLSLDNASELVLERIAAFCEMCGMTVTDLHNNQYARTTAHVVFFKGLEAQKQARPARFVGQPASFLAKPRASSRPSARQAIGDFKIVYSTKIEQGYQGTMLTAHGRRSRLLSYYALRERPQDRQRPDLEEYVRVGVLNGERNFLITTPRQNWEAEHYKDFRRRNLAARFSQTSEGSNESEAVVGDVVNCAPGAGVGESHSIADASVVRRRADHSV